MTAEVERLRAALGENQRHAETLSVKLVEAQSRNAVLEGQLSEMEALSDRMESASIEIDTLREHVGELEQDAEELERAHHRDTLRVRQLKSDLESRRKELALLRASLTWRATAPVRLAQRATTKAGKSVGAAIQVLRWAGYDPRRLRRVPGLLRDMADVEKSGLFDRDWYARSYPEVARSEIDPLVHFLTVGALEGKNPSPFFDTVYYAQQLQQFSGETAQSGPRRTGRK
jgi:hypothetical protein